MEKKPVLIALEGIDKCGKGTQINLLRHLLRFDPYLKFGAEPNEDNLIGKYIRLVLRGEATCPEKPLEFQRLFILERAVHMLEIRRDFGLGVRGYFTDRCVMSTLAYGRAKGLDESEIINIHRQALGEWMIWPTLNIFIDVPVPVALKRMGAEEKPELFEKADFLEKVRNAYLEEVYGLRQLPCPVVLVDGNRPPFEVFEDIKREAGKILDLGI